MRPTLRALVVAAAVVAAGLSCSSPSEPPEPGSIAIGAATSALDAIGATRQLTAIVRDKRDRVMPPNAPVEWSSDAPSVATVSGTGLVQVVSVGTANITATLDTLEATVMVTTTQVPVAPVIVSGNLQSAPAGTALANPVVVRVTDRLGSAMPGRNVGFFLVSGAGSLGTAAVVSDANGLASTTWTLGNSTSQQQTLEASVAGAATVTLVSATAVAGPPASLSIAPNNLADGQIANNGQAVPIRPAVRLADALGNPIVGATVTFAVTGGGGSITGGTATTDVGGVATVGSWTLGASSGANTLSATHAALTPVIFTVTGVTDRCSPEGAQPIAVGDTITSNLGGTDCQAVFANASARYELYRLTLAVRTSVLVEMSSPVFDTWLMVQDPATEAIISENDDIIRIIDTDSRVGLTLDPGSYLIRARGFDATQVGDYQLSVRTAAIGVPASVAATTPNGQRAAPGADAAVAPSITVLDEIGTPVPGVTVDFEVIGGIGSVGVASVVTDANGVASAGTWTLGAGANVVTATVDAPGSITGNPVIYSARGKAASAGFDIDLRFATVPTPSQLATFSAAAARWETIITGDIAAQAVDFEVGDCDSNFPIDETVDDLVIVVKLGPIDGAGGILGRAGPCATRLAPTLFPVVGTMEFDTADLAGLGSGLGDVILHEMGHVIGIGTMWAAKGFLELPSPNTGPGNDTHFDGPFAIAAFNAIGGATYTGGAKVPVENSAGGGGTRNAHWRESVLDNELMTGFYDGGIANPLSILTVQSLRDLGYVVDNAAADAFNVTTSLRAEGETGGRITLLDDVRRIPPVVLDRRGRPVGAVPSPMTKKPTR